MFHYLNHNDKKYRKIDDHLAILFNHSSMTMEEIRLLLDLTSVEFNSLLHECYKKGMLDTEFREYKIKEPKYYSISKYGDSYRFIIRKVINNKSIYYCTCRSESEARFIVSELKKVCWDKSKLSDIQAKIK